ncbi:BTB/POZ domain-containing adapter for CUL3-mediated RhoA degradation protein 3 isoform X2 [Nycticebus coucang]|uniref:BTB/POZ domain-containing adapter for CUL3-mediated RhoA degradation protein 3 isoform X2 n=1 Tax=Nycticebus coucang TaxID=9470 RepID=UPI00234C19D9|nr:BTB/POZ domain-containing adapter for CUL3-mediated RhoA degradation protein 3 isoform X2 [Nycticebus coucang]
MEEMSGESVVSSAVPAAATRTTSFKGTSPSSKYVKLNVGGALYYTTMQTLTKQDTMLKAMFSGRMEVLTDSEGWILIDRCGKHFGTILNYLRDGAVPLPESRREIEELLAEAKYYLVQGLVEECQAALQDQRGSLQKGPNTSGKDHVNPQPIQEPFEQMSLQKNPRVPLPQTRGAPLVTWGSLKKLFQDADTLMKQLGAPPTPENKFLACLTVISQNSAKNKDTYEPFCKVPVITSSKEEQKLIATSNKPAVKLLYNRSNNKYSYTSNSDDNMLKNIELFDKLSLRFNGRVLFIKDVIGDEICCWSFYGQGRKIAEVCCTSIVYATEKKQTKVEFPEARIYEETLNILLYEAQDGRGPDNALLEATGGAAGRSHHLDEDEERERERIERVRRIHIKRPDDRAHLHQ